MATETKVKLTKQQKELLANIASGQSTFATGYEARAGRTLETAGLIKVKRPAKTSEDRATWTVSVTGEGKKALKA